MEAQGEPTPNMSSRGGSRAAVAISGYLDKRAIVAILTLLFVVLNVALTALSFHPYFGAPFYGYGYAVSLLICVLVAMQWLEVRLSKLEYETFMLQ